VIRSVAPIVLFANEVLDILDGQRKSGRAGQRSAGV